MPTEYRLVLKAPLESTQATRLRDAEHAQKMADYWDGRVSQSTGDTGHVERREVTEWETVPSSRVESRPGESTP